MASRQQTTISNNAQHLISRVLAHNPRTTKKTKKTHILIQRQKGTETETDTNTGTDTGTPTNTRESLFNYGLNTQTHKHKKQHKYTHINTHTHTNTYTHTYNKTSIKKVVLNKANYINKLIKLYYNNDNVVSSYVATAPYKQHIFPQQNRVIVIGDIHGDFEVAIRCLILAKCIEHIDIPHNKTVKKMNQFFKKLKWSGTNTYVVQLGDQIDRVRPQSWDNNDISLDSAFDDEGSTLEIFYLFYHLNILASKHNGRVFSIIGNHEIMNVDGNFRYVSKKEFQCFKDHLKTVYNKKTYSNASLKTNGTYTSPSQSQSPSPEKTSTHELTLSASGLPNGYRERLHAFAPSGMCANLMAMNYYTMLQIGDWLFCHGSPTLYVAKTFSIDMVNNIVSLYLLGINNTDTQLQTYYNNIIHAHPQLSSYNETSILWARTFGEHIETETNEQKLLILMQDILNEYNKNNKTIMSNTNTSDNTNTNTNANANANALHIAIGHTPQFKKGINSICNNRVWRCDIGMSKAFLSKHKKNNINNNVFEHGDIQVLEINNGKPSILSENVK